MHRRPAFSFSLFHEHIRPSMGIAFPAAGLLPRAMQDALDGLGAMDDTPLTDRLLGLKRLFDDETREAAVSAS